jgi:hypothetical protein
MDVDAMDTGRYHAMVVQDPNDKRGIRGFIHIAMAEPVSTNFDGKAWRWRRGVQNLSDFMNENTDIRSDVNKSIYFDSEELFETPWVYLCRRYRFDITQSELVNLGHYMTSGGFLWGDSFGQTQGGYESGYNSISYTIIKSLETQGFIYQKDWTYDRLPNSHAILHCYYDFENAPMGWGASSKIWGQEVGWDNTPYLDAVVMDDVVVALKTKQAYANAWGDWGPNGLHESYKYLDPTRCFQFGVNTIIYALTREGSITHRVMDAVK